MSLIFSIASPASAKCLLPFAIQLDILSRLAWFRPPEPVSLAEFRIRRKQVLRGLTHEDYIAASLPESIKKLS